MSDLLRSLPSIKETAKPQSRPAPNVLTTTSRDRSSLDLDRDASSSDSSASTADSINTLRPVNGDFTASSSSHPPIPWADYFNQEWFLPVTTSSTQSLYHVYLTPPASATKGPLYICHHGAGASGMSFAPLAATLKKLQPEAGILSLEAREHGSTITTSTGDDILDFSLDALVSDTLASIDVVKKKLNWTALPPSVFIGHSLGGAIATRIAASGVLGASLIGFLVLDVVEGSAMEALSYMRTYLASRPSTFGTVDDAIEWHVRSRTLRNADSARISVPSLLTRSADGESWGWKTDLARTQRWWEEWFGGMSGAFLRGKAAKGLVLAGTDRLDRELMVGQMQGKFQLTVIPEAGHFVQEDVPERMAQIAVEFFRRNDRSAMVLPPKVSELLAQGKKV